MGMKAAAGILFSATLFGTLTFSGTEQLNEIVEKAYTLADKVERYEVNESKLVAKIYDLKVVSDTPNTVKNEPLQKENAALYQQIAQLEQQIEILTAQKSSETCEHGEVALEAPATILEEDEEKDRQPQEKEAEQPVK
ncbi:MAG: hypothetical protein ACRC5C_04080 [Bacilli bacterium]